MRSKTATIAAIVIGSFFVHCTQSMVGTMDGVFDGGTHPKDLKSGAVKDAKADTGSCVACDRETPTVLFDDVVKPEKTGTTSACTMATPVLDISAYRAVVIHSAKCQTYVQVRNGKAGFVLAAQDNCTSTTGAPPPPHPVTVNGTAGRELRVNFGSPYDLHPDPFYQGTCQDDGIAVTIVGYKNP